MEWWDLILYRPILNFLMVLTSGLFSNFGLAVIALTVIIRLVMLPLTLKQLRASKELSEKMQALQPKLQQVQKKYAKDMRKLQQETGKLYKEAGISPLGCLSSPMLIPLLIQFPIWIALYQAVIQAIAITPQDLLGLSQHLYSWSIVQQALPVSGKFLWLNLGEPDPYFIIALLVIVTMWVSQKMMTTITADPRQQQMNNMMQLMMPLLFGFITLTLPSGLGLYFVVSAIFSIIVEYFIYGWGNLFARSGAKQIPKKRAIKPGKYQTNIARQTSNPREGVKDGKSGSKRQDSGRSHSKGSGATGTQQRGGGGHRSEER